MFVRHAACQVGDEAVVHSNVIPSVARPVTASPERTVMLDPKALEEFAARLSAVIAASPAADIEKNARALLASFFTRLDLVTREEFDVQSEVLRRTREKLKALEERVARLEGRNANSAD